MTHQVDVIIAVHTPTRPIARAVASVLEGNGRHTRLSVVCHNVAVGDIRAVLPRAHRNKLTWLEHHDGVPSASGPFNAGMRAATGEFVSIVGSDDILQPGVVASWLDLARAVQAECVITRLAIGDRFRPVPTPPVRPRRRPLRLADPVRDRLSYRSAPLGLVSTAARNRLGAELVEGMVVGGDVPYVTRLWCETRVAVDTHGPAYVIGEGAVDRVTYASRPINEELAFVWHMLRQPWFTAYPEQIRTAVATKVLRIHIFGAVLNRPDPQWWTQTQRAALAQVTGAVAAAAPTAADPLSIADHRLFAAIRNTQIPAVTMIQRAKTRRRHGSATTVLPRHLRALANREAPARFMAASWWATLPGGRCSG